MGQCLVAQLKSLLVSIMTLAAVLHIEGTKVYAVVSRPDVAMTVSWGTSKASKAEGITGDSNLDFLRVNVHRDEWQRHVQERASLQQHVPVSLYVPAADAEGRSSAARAGGALSLLGSFIMSFAMIQRCVTHTSCSCRTAA
jgi:hypothetical protein